MKDGPQEVEEPPLVRSCGAEPKSGRPAADYVLGLCARVAACTDVPGTIERLFLSPATQEVHALLAAEMLALGMQVRVDAVGNLRGFYAAERVDAPVLLVGSHIDTVPNAGAFDGVLGVAMGLGVVRSLHAQKLAYAVEVIAFSEEEGVRFRLPFIGSRALIGTLGKLELQRMDADGVSVDRAIQDFGLTTDLSSGLTPGTFAFLECHIEQGPVLEALGLPLAVVTAIVGQTRLELHFSGRANHAGTTPMDLRQDALAAAAAWIGAVERYARGVDGMVATVGSIEVTPGAVNVIAASAVVSLDVRHAVDATRETAVVALVAAAEREASARGVSVAWRETSRQDAVTMDARLCGELGAAIEKSGLVAHRMFSGAGHDAMILAEKVPSAMLFVRTPHGLSHHPDEAVLAADVQAACDALSVLLGQLEAC